MTDRCILTEDAEGTHEARLPPAGVIRKESLAEF